MAGVNKAILVGNLGSDPEIRTLENGTKVASFSIATSESYKDKDGNRVDKTEWHNIVLWRGLAEVAEKYLKKGQSVYIEGKIQTRSWEDKEGVKRYTTDIVGRDLTMLGKKEDNGGAYVAPSAPTEADAPKQNTQESAPIGQGTEPDDLPF